MKIEKDFDLRKYLKEGRLLREENSGTYEKAWFPNHDDYKWLSIGSNQDYEEWVNEMKEENELDSFEAEYIEDIPKNSYIFIIWNDENITAMGYNTKKELVEDVDSWYGISDPERYDDFYDEEDNFREDKIEEIWGRILETSNDSYPDKDSASGQVVIENNKIVAHSPDIYDYLKSK